MTRSLYFRGALLALAGLCAPLKAEPMAYDQNGMPQFLAGACVHLLNNKGIPDSTLNMIKQGGFNAVRDEVSWGRCEQAKGQPKAAPEYLRLIDKERQLGLNPITILLYSNRHYDNGNYPRSPEAVEGFARYCETLVAALKGKNRLYQVWNEWDGGCGMEAKYRGTGDVDSYMKLLKNVYPRIKKIDPQAIVISNSVCTGDAWLESELKQGLLQTCDVVALHTYNYSRGEGMNTPEKWHERMVGVDRMLRGYNQGKPFPLYVTEMGWPNQIDNRGSTHETTAMYLARTYLLARTLPYIKGLWWYDFQDDGWDYRYNEDNFGIIRPDQTPKAAYHVMHDLAPVIKDAEFVRRVPSTDPDIWILQFRFNGKDLLAMWSSHADDEWQVSLKNNEVKPASVMVHHAGRLPYSLEWGSREFRDKSGGKVSMDTLRFSLNGMPLLLEGRLAGVALAGIEKKPYPDKSRPQKVKLRLPQYIATITPAGVKEQKFVDFGLEANYAALNSEKWQGRDDLSARFAVSYDREKLYLTVEVTDNVFSQKDGIEEAWRGDGLQFAFQRPDDGGSLSDRTELDAALTPEGPRLLRRCAQDGGKAQLLDNGMVKITRQGNTVKYEMAMPYKELGLKPLESGATLAFSLLVNENDGNGRKGFLHWGNGIGLTKDPSQYFLLMAE